MREVKRSGGGSATHTGTEMDSSEDDMTAGIPGANSSEMAGAGGGDAFRRIPASRLPEEIERALRQSEFELFLQPQVALHDFSISGVETLLRWRHPLHGLILPGEFLPAAEAGGQMRKIGQWVMGTVGQYAGVWRGWMGEHSRVAVNVSPSEILDPEFLSTALDALDVRRGVECGVELELLESSILGYPARTRRSIELLRGMGIRLALDDFGVGYSSLSSLNEYPFTKLKIDRGFVQRLSVSYRSRAIVRSMIELAKDLGIEVNAEGVESPEQLQYLSENGCDEVQGYLIARPMPAARFENWAAGFLGKHPARERGEEEHAGNVIMFRGRAGASRR